MGRKGKAALQPGYPPARLVCLRRARCEPACDEWISAEGKIDKLSLRQFRAAFKALGDRKAPILIHSGGGDVEQDPSLGRDAPKQ